MTLPAASFVRHAAVAAEMAKKGMTCAEGAEEAAVLRMEGPFEQKTGGKGANAASAAGQTFACEFFGNFGAESASENERLLADLAAYGGVETGRCATLASTPTGTAYILLFDDGDNAILLLGGANQSWPPPDALCVAASPLSGAMEGAVAVMLQREVPAYVNVAVARAARANAIPVVFDVGGTDAPLDEALLPFVSLIGTRDEAPIPPERRVDQRLTPACAPSLACVQLPTSRSSRSSPASTRRRAAPSLRWRGCVRPCRR
jgi:sugar/nucleoside kinase (ribokinase family)